MVGGLGIFYLVSLIRQTSKSKKIISYAIKDLDFKNLFELGCGPGTWTKAFLNKNQKAKFLLVDISKKMLDQAKKNLKNYKNIKYIEEDFLKFKTAEKFDCFFLQEQLNISQIKKK